MCKNISKYLKIVLSMLQGVKWHKTCKQFYIVFINKLKLKIIKFCVIFPNLNNYSMSKCIQCEFIKSDDSRIERKYSWKFEAAASFDCCLYFVINPIVIIWCFLLDSIQSLKYYSLNIFQWKLISKTTIQSLF